MNEHLQTAVDELDHEARALRARLDGLNERLTVVEGAVRLLAELGVFPGSARPAAPPLASSPVEKASKAASAPAGKKAAARPPRPASLPPEHYQRVADAAKAARAAGEPVQTTLAKQFGVPQTTIKNWLHKCVSLGLITVASRPAVAAPKPAAPTVPKGAFTPDDARRAIDGAA